jgi:hypothetical protein
MSTASRVALGVVGLLLGVAAVLSLREATLSTHDRVAAGSHTELVVHARSHSAEPTQTLAEIVEAVLVTCRLEVTSDPTGPVEDLGDGDFRVTLAPALDQTNRRQLRGCVEDWAVDHALVDVVSLGSR